jgi:hypothetical protein
VRDSRMDKDIKITLIATGFEISPLTCNKVNEAEMNGYIKALKSEGEEQMDVPAFLRQAQFTHHAVTPAPAPQKQAQKAPSFNSWNK